MFFPGVLDQVYIATGATDMRKSINGLSIKFQYGPETLPLFDMPEPADEDEPEGKVHVPAHDRRKRGRKPLPEDLPRFEVVHDIDDADKICACGCQLTRIGEEVSEQLDIIPAKMQVIKHIRPKYACKNCEGVEDDGPTVKIAPVPPRIIPPIHCDSGSPGPYFDCKICGSHAVLPARKAISAFRSRNFENIHVQLGNASGGILSTPSQPVH